jgi:DNA-binding response OmpR family regulator
MRNQGYILMVEDDAAVQDNNKEILERRGHNLKQAYTLAEAREIIDIEPPAAIVLDIGLPDGSGLDFLYELRKASNVPALMLTAMGTPEDVIKGLETGGDSYLTKPYNLRVFMTHIETLLRRASIIPDTLVFGIIKLIPASSSAYINGEDMILTQKEFALLAQFIQQPDKILSAEYLYEKVWGQGMAGDNQAIKKAVHRLRSKLEHSGYTITVERGEGYIFEQY